MERGAGRTHCLQREVIYMQMRIIINYGNEA
uniref:Uncharacterized protein n=1 Tax=Ralstonia syzygii R24 TaxID=907261 RepID=G3A8F2_9RALS|nr:conserved hypothetical protein [Ralstonia syzygii R24]